MEYGSYGQQLLNEDVYLMEVKINSAVPIWFTRMLSELKIYLYHFQNMELSIKNM